MASQSGMQTGFSVDEALVEESQRTFMSRVYRWMFAGLVVTGSMSMYAVSNPDLRRFVAQSFWLLLIAEFGLVLALSFFQRRLSGTAAAAMFLLYAALNGLMLSGVFLWYRLGSIGEAFMITAGTFGALSFYGAVTKRDLGPMRSFLFMGLVGLLLAGVVNLFIRSDMLSFVWSCASVVVFAGFTAYDNQKLRQMHAASGYSSSGSLAINGALALYLDFINLFLAILRLFGGRRR
jgi:FtsH-binding integral membrane protein